MTFVKYLAAHFMVCAFTFCVGYYVCKKFPTMFGALPVLGSGSL